MALKRGIRVGLPHVFFHFGKVGTNTFLRGKVGMRKRAAGMPLDSWRSFL
jgi:hypothetical protein